MELYSPQIQVAIGGYLFSQGIELTFCSAADSYFDWAKIRFVSPFEQVVTIKKHDPASVLLGYNGSFTQVFEGYAVCDFVSGETGNEVLLKDGMILLEQVMINSTFVQVTPQEIVSHAANLAGVTKLVLDDATYQPIACLPILRQNGIEAIRSLDHYWRIHQQLYFLGGALHWGKADEPAQAYHFEYAKNIIRLARADNCWELETVSVPFVRHSGRIRVTHPKISGDFTVHRLRVSSRGPGFIRTTLYFKED